jgi:hypothetical protein
MYPVLGNDRETDKYATTVLEQQFRKQASFYGNKTINFF